MAVAQRRAKPEETMDIRFISTLTADDEGQMAPALMNAVTALLDALPIAYTLRIETLGAQVFQHTHPSAQHSAMAIETPARNLPERLANLHS
jgi:hypothetical protein